MRTKGRVREYADKHPTATVREIQTALGLSSPSVVQFHLKVDSKDNIIEAKDKRIAELEAALTWQPIETAPKDGTLILACGGTFFDSEDTYAHNYAIVSPVIVYWKNRDGWWSGGSFWYEPTHWMPLPQPPKEG